MKALATALLVLVAACGEGRVIFNVDVLSFLPAADSTRAYNVPGGVPLFADSTTRQFSLPPGLGSSSVDSVSATVAAVLDNTGGAGTVTLDIFFAKTQGALFSGTPYVSASSGAVSGVQTVPFGSTTVSLSDSVFNGSDLWVGLRVRFSTNAGPNMTGQARLTDLSVRVVLQDKIL